MKNAADIASITKAQIRMIKSLQRNNLDDLEYREILEKHFRVGSCTQLSQRQAGVLIDLFAKWGFFVQAPRRRDERVKRVEKVERVENVGAGPRACPQKKAETPRRPGKTPKNVVRLASQAQREKIAALASLITWRVEDGLSLWMQKRMKVERVRTAQEAFLVIEGLKKMFENQMKAQYGKNWWARAYDDVGIRRYIAEHKM